MNSEAILDSAALEDLHLLGNLPEIADDVRRIEQAGRLNPDTLLKLLVPISGYRRDGRLLTYQRATQSTMRLAEHFGWRRLLARLTDIDGLNYVLQDRLADGRASFARAAQLAEDTGDTDQQIKSLRNVMTTHLDDGDPSQAVAVLLPALALARAAELPIQELALLLKAADIALDAADFTIARSFYESAREIARRLGDSASVTRADTGLAIVRFNSEPVEASIFEDTSGRRSVVYEKRPDEDLRDFASNAQRGRVLRFEWTEWRMAEARRRGDADEIVDALIELSSMRGHQGELQEAVVHAREAVALAEQAGNRRKAAVALYNLGRALGRSGDQDGARSAWQRCLVDAERQLDRRFQAHVHFALATCELTHERSALHYQRALELFEAVRDQQNVALVVLNGGLAAVEFARRHGAQETATIEEHLRTAEYRLSYAQRILESRDPPAINELGLVRSGLAAVRLMRGDLSGAIQEFRELVDVFDQLGDESAKVQMLHQLSIALHDQGELAAARDTLRRALAVFESRLIGIATQSLQIPFLVRGSEMFTNMVAWLLPAHTAEAFEYAERARSRVLLQLLGHADVPQPQSVARSELGMRERQLTASLQRLRAELEESDSNVSATELLQDYRAAEADLRSVYSALALLTAEANAYVDLRRGSPLAYAAARALLRDT